MMMAAVVLLHSRLPPRRSSNNPNFLSSSVTSTRRRQRRRRRRRRNCCCVAAVVLLLLQLGLVSSLLQPSCQGFLVVGRKICCRPPPPRRAEGNLADAGWGRQRRSRRVATTTPVYTRTPTRMNAGSSSWNTNDDEGAETGGEDIMKDLILSLSNISNDEERRTELARIFDEHLQHDTDSADHFASQFNTILIDVGEGIRQQAAEKAASQAQAEVQKQQQQKDNSEDEIDDELPSFPLPGQQHQKKSDEELQLWAVIDMMVQSKTIIKKASGKFGPGFQ